MADHPHPHPPDPGSALREYALLAACALIVIHPLAVHGPSCGHDFDFHLQSWLAVASGWHAGLLTPHWITGANYGAGEPRFVFYPPASWALGALLGLLLPWTWVPSVFTFLALFAGGCTARAMARQWMPSPAATLTGGLYLANPYLLFTAYERSAYGELLAAAWIPLLLLYALRPVGGWRQRLVPLALILAALWFTNAPAAVMGCYLAVFSSFFAATARRWREPLFAIAAVALGTTLAGVYVYPAWYEQRWVQIARSTASGMRIEDSFLFGHTGEPFHDQVLRTASWIAVSILAAAALGAVFAYRRRETAVLWRTLLAISAGILLLLFGFSAPLWNWLPELHFLQFPWRWLLVAGLAAAALLALAAPRRWPRATTAVLLAFALGSSLWAARQLWQFCDEEDNVQAQLQTQDAGFEGTDEYTAGVADNGEIQQGLPPVRLLRTPDADEGDDRATSNPRWQPGQSLTGQFAVSRWDLGGKKPDAHRR